MSCAPWPPPRRGKPLFIAVPASVIANEPGLALKSIRASEIVRAAALFRADRIVIYKGRRASREEMKLFTLLARYAATPPHLKKKAFPLDERLRYVGLMKPLQTPAHTPPNRLERGSVIAGLVEGCGVRHCRVSFGSMGPGIVAYRRSRPRRGDIVPVRIVSPPARGRPAKGEIYMPPYYWNPSVRPVASLAGYLRETRSIGFLVVGASRLGNCAYKRARRLIARARGIVVVFGGPRTHVWEEAPRTLYDIFLNTAPLQGTRTVRVEEAIITSLSVLEAII